MNRIFSIASSIILTLFLISCDQSDDPPSPEGIVIAKEVKVIDQKTWQDNFLSIDSSTYTLTFSKNLASSQQFNVGDVIVSAEGEGLLRKVKTVSTINNELKVQTEPATITEVIQQGTIEFDQPLTISQIKSVEYHYTGVQIKTDDFNKGNPKGPIKWDINTVLYDEDGNQATSGDQIKLFGTFNCDWRFALRMDIGFSEGLKEVKFGFESTESLDLELVAGMQYHFEKKVTLATVNFSPITVFVAAVPIVFTPQLKIIAGIDGSANASVTSKITQSMSFNSGIQYLKNTGWAPYSTFDKNFVFQPPQVNLNANAGAYLKPELLIKVYAIAGPYTNLKLYSRLDANLLQTPWWKLYGGITMNAGAKVDILDKFLLEYTVSDLIKHEQLLAQANTPPVLSPSLTTTEVSLITASTARSGGNISGDGGAAVSSRGIAYGTSQNPTISGSTVAAGSGTGSFTANMSGLSPNTTYYVRAYATNSTGTAYGNQVSFTTVQSVTLPTVSTSTVTSITTASATGGGNVTATGGSTVTARGIAYGTSQNPTISGSTVAAGSGTGSFTANMSALSPNTTYYVRAYATNSTGTGYGNQVSFITVSGGSGGFNDVVNPTTGKTWMDRNLGASRVATSSNDAEAYGYLYQWGRGNDGHQLRTSGTTTTLSNSDTPGHGNFILAPNNPSDWRSPQNTNLWQGVNGINNPCPAGYRVPTNAEWNAERLSWNLNDAIGAFSSSLKLPVTGIRRYSDGLLIGGGSYGNYWSSNFYDATFSWNMYFQSNFADTNISYRAEGLSIRCIKN